jgi:hypothetical protein
MTYTPKLKHILNDFEDGDFKTKEELKEALEIFKKEDFVEYYLKMYDQDKEEGDNEEDF